LFELKTIFYLKFLITVDVVLYIVH